MNSSSQTTLAIFGGPQTIYLGFEMCLKKLLDDDGDLIVFAFRKVWERLEELK